VSIKKAFETLVKAEPVTVHTAMANEKRFLLMLGSGYDSLAVAALRSDQKKRFGAIAYILAAARALFKFRNMRMEIDVDGIRHSAGTVVVTNARYYGGPFLIASEGGIEKPRLDVVILKGAGIFNAFRYGFALLLNRLHHLPDVDIVVTDKPVTLTAAEKFPCQCDGDGGLVTPVHISLDLQSLRILRAANP
jgi:diacylglycerol kinase family enzyme